MALVGKTTELLESNQGKDIQHGLCSVHRPYSILTRQALPLCRLPWSISSSSVPNLISQLVGNERTNGPNGADHALVSLPSDLGQELLCHPASESSQRMLQSTPNLTRITQNCATKDRRNAVDVSSPTAASMAGAVSSKQPVVRWPYLRYPWQAIPLFRLVLYPVLGTLSLSSSRPSGTTVHSRM